MASGLKILVLCLCHVTVVFGVRPGIPDYDDLENSIQDGTILYSEFSGKFYNEPRYLVIASRIIRPGQVYRLAVSILSSPQPLVVRASLHRDHEQVTSAAENMTAGQISTLLMRVPFNSIHGNYRLRVEGNVNGVLGGTGFLNETEVQFSERFLTILIQTNQLVYNVEQTIAIRVILLTTEVKHFTDPVDVYLIDSRGFIMKRWVSVYPYLGFVNIQFDLPYDYTTGWWTVRVMALGQTEEKKILLERWFGHRYDVNVIIPPFILNSEESLEGGIMCNYTNVAVVTGNATIRAYVRPLKNYYNKLPESHSMYLQEVVDLFYGVYDFSFPMDKLRQLARPVPLERCEIEVQAIVGERFMDVTVTGYARARVINASISLRFLGVSPQIFKPGMTFATHIMVSYHDLVPLPEEKLLKSSLRIDVQISGGSRFRQSPIEKNFTKLGVLDIEIPTPSDADKIILRATYTDDEDRAYTELTLLSHYSSKERYLRIITSTKTAEAGEYAIFHVSANFYLKNFHYLVISKGIIIAVGTEDVTGMIYSITTFSVPVSPEMAPVCHIVVYHVTSDGEVITDSVALPVHAINRKKFILDLNLNLDRSAKRIELVPKLTTESIVGICGIDTDHLSTHGRNDLTPASVMEAMYEFERDNMQIQRALWRDRETGLQQISYFTTTNYGKDSNQTFTLANLVVFTNMAVTSAPGFCNVTAGFGQCQNGFCYPLDRKCDGHKDCNDGTDEGTCESFHEDQDLIDFYVYRRNRQYSFFDGTGGNFAWKNKILGDDSVEFVPCESPKGPSVWRINAIAMSKVYGLAIVEDPIVFDSTKPFFIIVEAPENAVVGEQIGLRVAVLNFQLFEIKVELILPASPDYRFVQVESFGYVSTYNPRTTTGEHQHLVYVKPVNQMFVHIPVVLTRIGEIEITVTGRTQVAKDSETITINVVADGVPVSLHTSLLLDMRSESHILRYLDINVTEYPIIPFEETYRLYIFGSPKASVSVIGDVVGASLIPDISNPFGISILHTAPPVKSGEHIMFNFAYNLYTLIYLRLSNQLKPDVTKGMLELLNRAYVYQTVFYKDGAFTMFENKPSVWLTAYCARVYYDAQYPDWENYLFIDPAIISDSIKFLLKHQTQEGSFFETTGNVWNRKMNPELKVSSYATENKNVALTAHVLITLATVTDLQGRLRMDAISAKSKAVYYLENQMALLNDTYEIALVSYALMITGSPGAKDGFNKLENRKREADGMIYWSPEAIPPPETIYQTQRTLIQPRRPRKYDSLAVETTAYALMLYLAYSSSIPEVHFKPVDMIVKWLNVVRMHENAFISSQDTIVAVKALTAYSISNHIRDVINIGVSVESSSNPRKLESVNVNQDNLAQPQRVVIQPNVWGHAEIQAKGAGMAVLQMDVQYNVDKDFLLIQPPVPSFDLTVRGYYHGRNKSHLNIQSCARWTFLSESDTSGLAVIEISLPTGYFTYKPIIDKYVEEKTVARLQRGRVYFGSAVFMFDYLDNSWSCVKFTVQRWYPVANVTRYLKARVYDYYIPERYKEIIYENFDLHVVSICEVCGSYQCPYCPYFSTAVKPLQQWLIILISISFLYLLRRIC